MCSGVTIHLFKCGFHGASTIVRKKVPVPHKYPCLGCRHCPFPIDLALQADLFGLTIECIRPSQELAESVWAPSASHIPCFQPQLDQGTDEDVGGLRFLEGIEDAYDRRDLTQNIRCRFNCLCQSLSLAGGDCDRFGGRAVVVVLVLVVCGWLCEVLVVVMVVVVVCGWLCEVLVVVMVVVVVWGWARGRGA